MARSDSEDEGRERKKARKEKKEHKEKKRDKEDKERKKDRDRREKEKERERDDEKEKSTKAPPPPPPASKPKTNDSGGEISMSVDDTNKMRAELGLKPLQEVNEEDKKRKEEDDKQRAEKEAEDKRLDAEARIERARYERLKHQVLPGKSIGEEEDAEIDDTAAWIQKSRRLEEAKKKKEKEEAEKKARQLDEMDEEAEQDEEEYTAAGVKIAHGVEEFDPQATQILTLKDKGVLDADGDVDSDEDELENVDLVEKQKLARNKKRLKKQGMGAHALDDEEFDEHGNPKEKRLLSKYDEETIEKKTLKLDASGKFDAKVIEKQERIRQKLMAQAAGKKIENLNVDRKSVAEYYTSEEVVAFKKPKMRKVKRVRKRGELGFEPEEDTGQDRGSRSDGRVLQRDIDAEETQQRKDASYNLALASEVEMTNMTIKGEVAIEDIDSELGGALARLEKVAGRQGGVDDGTMVAEVIRADEDAEWEAWKAEQEMEVDETEEEKKKKAAEKKKKEDETLVFQATEEFCRGIQVVKEKQVDSRTQQMMHAQELRERMAAEKKKEEERKAKEAAKEELRKQQEEGWVPMENLETKRDEDDEEMQDQEEEDVNEDELGIEKAVGSSMVAALQYFKTKEGDLNKPKDIVGGRSNDRMPKYEDKWEHIRFSRKDEFGRELTPKEEFRMLSHRFHGKFPGKMKQEKRLKKFEEEMRMRHTDADDTPMNTLKNLYQHQEKTSQPYIVLNGGQAGKPEESALTVENLARASGGKKKIGKKKHGGGGGSVIPGHGSVIPGGGSMIPRASGTSSVLGNL